MNQLSGYIDVDRLQAETTLEQAAAKCGVPLDVKGSGGEVRIDCQFGCAGDHCGRKEIAINTENPQKVFQCHAYECGFRGNLLALMHGFLTGSKPSSGKLKAFKLLSTSNAKKRHHCERRAWRRRNQIEFTPIMYLRRGL